MKAPKRRRPPAKTSRAAFTYPGGERVNIAVGDQVLFGRPQDQKTRGVVLRVAAKSALVQTLEEHGTGRASDEGAKWRVPLKARYISVVRHGRGKANASAARQRAPIRRAQDPAHKARVTKAVVKVSCSKTFQSSAYHHASSEPGFDV